MKTAFVDATYYIALLNRHDQYELAATQIANGYDGRFVTTTLVLTEVCNSLSSPRHRLKTSDLIKELEEADDTDVIHPDRHLWQRSVDLFAARADKSWSLTDCLSFLIMQDRGIREALTADRHFEQAGFTILLK